MNAVGMDVSKGKSMVAIFLSYSSYDFVSLYCCR